MEEIELGISVIICCYNSAKRLPETIRHIAVQQVHPSIKWEVIVVDNASTDDTRLVSEREWEKHVLKNISYTIVEQPVAGLLNARKKGIEHAKFEYLIFCDDDNHLQEDYVEVAYNIMSGDSTIGVLGGCGIFEPEQPAWPEIWLHKASYVNGIQSWAKTDHWVYGAGAVLRKSVLIKLNDLGWQALTTGRTGAKLISGEDVELCFIHYLMGYQIVSSDLLVFKHFVPIGRQNIKYIEKLLHWKAYSYFLLTPCIELINNDKHRINKTVTIMRNTYLKRSIKSAVHMFISLIRFTTPPFEVKKQWLVNTGMLHSILTNKKRVVDNYQHLVKLLLTINAAAATK